MTDSFNTRNVLIGAVCAALIVAAICVAAVLVMQSNNDRDVRVKTACIAARGTYVGGTCVTR